MKSPYALSRDFTNCLSMDDVISSTGGVLPTLFLDIANSDLGNFSVISRMLVNANAIPGYLSSNNCSRNLCHLLGFLFVSGGKVGSH